MAFRRFFGIKNESLSCRNGVVRLESNQKYISFSVKATKNLIEFIQELIFFLIPIQYQNLKEQLLFEYTNLLRFFKRLSEDDDISIDNFNNWCSTDISNSKDDKNKIIQNLLPESTVKQEELSLLIFMNIEFLQTYYIMYYTLTRTSE